MINKRLATQSLICKYSLFFEIYPHKNINIYLRPSLLTLGSHNQFIKKILMIKKTGLPVYQESYIKENQDQVLLSGFLTAVLVFSRHIGSVIKKINIDNLIYYIKIVHTLIVVTGTEVQMDETEIEKFYNKLENSKEFREFAEEVETSKIVRPKSMKIKQMQKLVRQILDELNLSPTLEESRISSIDELIVISEIVLKFKKGVPSKEIAEQIFGEGLQLRDKNYIEKRIEFIDLFKDTIHEENAIKDNLSNLSTYLQRTLRASNLFGF